MGEKVYERRPYRHHDSFVLTIPKIMVERHLRASEGQSIRICGKDDRVVMVAGGSADDGEGMDKYERALDMMMSSKKADARRRPGTSALEKLRIK